MGLASFLLNFRKVISLWDLILNVGICFKPSTPRQVTSTTRLQEWRRAREALPDPFGFAPASGGMSFFFRGGSRQRPTPQEIVRSIKDSLVALDNKTGTKVCGRPRLASIFPSAPGRSACACFLQASRPTPARCSWVFMRLSCFVSRVVHACWICPCVCRIVWTIDSRILATDWYWHTAPFLCYWGILLGNWK
jgi:hypothetical protein